MELVREFNLRGALEPPVNVGARPQGGVRQVFIIKSGEVEGERLRGTITPGGGEWALLGEDGFIRIDVRLQVVTHDDAHVYVQYVGLLELNEGVQNALATGGQTEYGDQYFFTNPRLETGDERYAWVNTTFFVGRGRIRPDLSVEYEVMRPASA